MNDWTAGYVSDVEYLPGTYIQQTPSHIDAACLVCGVEPPVALGAPFRYCDLGCGVGETAMVVAAANMQSEVWAFDFNPAHVARGRALVEAAGLSNMHMEEASFEQLAGPEGVGLPTFDYITLHGVWSWVSPESRAYIVRFIDRHLKPGGVAYVTYNSLPAWSGTMPAQRLLAMLSAMEQGSSDRRVARATANLRLIAKAGSAALPEDVVSHMEKQSEKGNFAYLSHEYLNTYWSPCWHADVAGDLAAAKLSYVGSANLFENFPAISMLSSQREAVSRQPEALKETLQDFFLSRSFRRDIFARGPRRIPERRVAARLREFRLAMTVRPDTATRKIKVPIGEAELNETFYAPALKMLSQGPASVGELLDLPEADGSSAEPQEVIGMLIGSAQASAARNAADPDAVAQARSFNLATIRNAANQGIGHCAIAAVVPGISVIANIFEMLSYEALVTGVPPEVEAVSSAAWRILAGRGDRLTREGSHIEDEAENLAAIRQQIPQILELTLPHWRGIGAI